MINRTLLILLCFLLIMPVLGAAEQEDSSLSGVLPVSWTAPKEAQAYTENLTDNDPFTTVTLRKGEALTMRFRSGSVPDRLYFDLFQLPPQFILIYLDANNKSLLQKTVRPESIHFSIKFERKDAAAVRLVADGKDLILSEWYACTEAFQMPFPDTGAHADVMIILDQPGDELELLSGLAAMLAGEHGLSVQMIYITEAPGYETHQCIQVLQEMGIKREPIFGTARNSDSQNTATLQMLLGGEGQFVKRYASLICEMTPDILIAPGLEKNSSRVIRSVIANYVLKAASKAAEGGKGSEAAHLIKKVYTISPRGQTVVSMEVPLYAYGGISAVEAAASLYTRYAEKRVYRRQMPKSVAFSLQYTAVGDDDAGNDLLEHISTDRFKDYRVPTPVPTETPEPTEEPSPTPTPESTDTPAPTEEPAPTVKSVTTEEPRPAETPQPAQEPALIAGNESQESSFRVGTLLPFLIGILGSIVLWLFFLKRIPAKNKWMMILPLLIGGGVTVLLLFGIIPSGCSGESAEKVTEIFTAAPTLEPTETPQPTQEPTPAPTAAPSPTEEPTPEPTETPQRTQEPTPEPTAVPDPAPTPDPDDVYYLDSDGEVYELDFENGHWWYKNRSLSIDIREHHSQYLNKGPLVYYVADIRMRDYSSYRSGIRAKYTIPWKFAREDRAVLAVTGDCMNNELDQKGCLIRNGVFYGNRKGADVLVIEDDCMSMRVISAKDASERFLMDNGIRNTYSFGPALVENGKISKEAGSHRMFRENPRAGIGMIEPGHWIAIVTDGRQEGYSVSISLEFFAQIFIDCGCTVAFNMDGGSSGGMVFMGEMLNRHQGNGTVDVQRSWLDAVEFGYSDQIPSPDQNTIHDGYQH